MLPESFPEIFTVEGDYAQRMREAETEFVRELVDKLASGRLGGIEVWRRMHELRDSGARRRGHPAQARRGVPRRHGLGALTPGQLN